MKKILLLPSLLLTISLARANEAKPSDTDLMRSPRNQIYQFAISAHGNTPADKVTDTIRNFLWIPEHCKKIRGLLIFGQNVPEGLIAQSPAIRKVCADNDLGIYYSTMNFYDYGVNPKSNGPSSKGSTFLQSQLQKLADLSGYPEVATVPWLPIGESMAQRMVDALAKEAPDRCMAVIFSNDSNTHDYGSVPTLGYQGTSPEWRQKSPNRNDWTNCDITTWWKWTTSYKETCNARKAKPSRPLSMIQFPGGHFNCTEEIIQYYANYIDAVAKARLSDDGSPNLKPVDLGKGYLARLPIYKETDSLSIDSARGAVDVARPWFFTRELAKQAQQLAAIDWNAKTQLPSVENGENAILHPWSHNDVHEVYVTTDSKFSLKPVLLDKIPEGFCHAGEPLAKSHNQPTLRWLRGSVIPLGQNSFQVELDRNYKNSEYNQPPILTDSVQGDNQVRYSVQPIMIKLLENTNGTAQTIDFKKIEDVTKATRSVPLIATASSGLPVKFFVDSGPAMIESNSVVFTPIPPSTKFPVAVTVAAWQWGTCKPPLFNKVITYQTFQITK